MHLWNKNGDQAQCFLGAGIYPVSQLTEEHLPPKGAFPKRLHGELPTFGACRRCNESWKKYDESFRDSLIKYLLADVHLSEVEEVRRRVFRAEQGRSALGMRPTTSPVVDVVSPGPGGVIARRPVAQPDPNIISAIACRTVSALYFLVRRSYLDVAADITASYVDPGEPYYAKAISALACVKPGMRRSFAGGHFQFTWRIEENDPTLSERVWCYYGAAYFYGRTHRFDPKQRRYYSEMTGQTFRLLDLLQRRSAPCDVEG